MTAQLCDTFPVEERLFTIMCSLLPLLVDVDGLAQNESQLPIVFPREMLLPAILVYVAKERSFEGEYVLHAVALPKLRTSSAPLTITKCETAVFEADTMRRQL